MEELNILRKLERVKAPPDFEKKVLAHLPSRRKGRYQRIKILRFSLGGAFALLIVFFVVLNVFVLPKKSPEEFAGLERDISSTFQRDRISGLREVIPITEVLDYSREMQGLSYEPRTIFILEQVSEAYNIEIKY